jgi:hypothetical protein
MGSVTEAQYCAMGERCKLYDAETGKSQKLGRYHKGTICDRCRAAGYHPEDAPIASNAGLESPELEMCSACRRLATQLVNPMCKFIEQVASRALKRLVAQQMVEQEGYGVAQNLTGADGLPGATRRRLPIRALRSSAP